jgi:tetratricopeptide (TPR) repeat protein
VQALIQRWLKKLQDRRDGLEPADPQAAIRSAQRIREGNAALAAGDLAQAAECYRAAMALTPRDPAPHVNLGYVLLERGDVAAAEASLQEAVSLGGGADAHYMLGQAFAAQARWHAAKQSLQEAVAARPDFGFAWRELGRACEQLGDPAAALDAYQRAARHSPELVDAIGACARLNFDLGRHELAVALARRWGAAAPQEWSAPFIEGQALHALKQHADALAALDRAAAIAMGNPVVAFARGNVLFAVARFEEADRAYADALTAEPGWIEAQVNRGVVLDRLGRHAEALSYFEQVLAQDGGHKLALYCRPMALVSAGRVDEALDAVEHARTLHPDDPDFEWHYAFAHLLAGRMQEGWPAYEARWKAVAATGAALASHPFREPLWTGQPLEGKTLLLHPEQGLGDILQFIRFVPVLESLGARVLVWAPESLRELLSTAARDLVVASRLEDLPAFDYQCPLMSVARVLRTTIETVPAGVPYLHADPERRRQWAQRLGEARGLRVGVVWSGNPAQRNDGNRSIPLSTFAQLAVPGCEFIALQNAVRDEDRAALQAWPQLRFFGEELKTFADTAALATQMDLVISVCTSGAHLAGALGMPMWVLLAYRADWRWLLAREDSPWYPTARLFRQDASRSWPAVIERVRGALVEHRDAWLKSPASA